MTFEPFALYIFFVEVHTENEESSLDVYKLLDELCN